MRYIDSTIYASRRSAPELEQMALAGITGVIEPMAPQGYVRRHAESFFEDAERLLENDAQRVNRYGIGYGVCIGLPAYEASNFVLCQQILEHMGKLLQHERVVALGEIGLAYLSNAEETLFRHQLQLARQHQLPVVVALPTHNRREVAARTVTVLQEEKFAPSAVLINGVTEETWAYVRDYGAWIGLTLDAQTHLSLERAKQLIEHGQLQGVLINSAAGRLMGDPLAVARFARYLHLNGYTKNQIEEMVYHNPKWFYSQRRALPLMDYQQTQTNQTVYRHPTMAGAGAQY